MFPNPQDALPLPAAGEIDPLTTWADALPLACAGGVSALTGWAKTFAPPALVSRIVAHAEASHIRAGVMGLTDAAARDLVAHLHGFADWTALRAHRDASLDSQRVRFERAADAIIAGDLATLDALLTAEPALAYARSDRLHGATLLHYVSANGVEIFRQRTPDNIVAIAQRLLEAGAEVDATCDVYGGGATTLGLVVTSTPPRIAGRQQALAELLLQHGARVSAGSVRSCLANGCPEAAAQMATQCEAHGISLALDEAAGLGRRDLMTPLLDNVDVTAAVCADAMQMAAWYGQHAALELLLSHGVPIDARAPDGGDTVLHVASYLGNAPLVAWLLAHGAEVDAVDERWGTTPLVWALHAWTVEHRPTHGDYRAVLSQLLDAGARVEPDWVTGDVLDGEPELRARLMARTV